MNATNAPTIDELELVDDPARWIALGFTVADCECQLGAVRMRFVRDPQRRGLVGWSLRDVASTELDGLPTALSQRSPHEPAPAHPNGVLAIDHIVAMSSDFQRSIAAMQAAGLDLRRVRDEPTPAGAPRQAFFRLGTEILELVQEPDEVVARRAGRRDGHDSARFWGLALLVDDLDRAVAGLGEHAGEIRSAVQPGRRIATVRRSAGLAVPLALMNADRPIGSSR